MVEAHKQENQFRDPVPEPNSAESKIDQVAKAPVALDAVSFMEVELEKFVKEYTEKSTKYEQMKVSLADARDELVGMTALINNLKKLIAKAKGIQA